MTPDRPRRQTPHPRCGPPCTSPSPVRTADVPSAPPSIPGPRRSGCCFVHFFLLKQDGEVTLIDAGLSGYRDTLEPALSVFDRRLRNPGLPVRQA